MARPEYVRKRQILGMLCLNFSLDGATLVPTMRSPFDLMIEGQLVPSSRGDRIRTCGLVVPNHTLYQAELRPAD